MLEKSLPLVAGLAKLEIVTTGRRDPGQPFTAEDVSVNRELHACGFYTHSQTNHNITYQCCTHFLVIRNIKFVDEFNTRWSIQYSV